MREQLLSEERRRQAEALFIEQAEDFRNMVYEQPDTLEPVAEELGLEIKTSEWFSRTEGTGIASHTNVREAAFSDDVYLENLNSEAVELDLNSLVALRKEATEPASLRPLAEVRADIEQTLRRAKARQQAAELGAQLLAELRGGAQWLTALTGKGLKAEQVTRQRRSSEVRPTPAVLEEVFRTGLPDGTDKPGYGGLVTAGGEYVLFRLSRIEEGDPAAADAETRQRIENDLRSRRGFDQFLGFQRGLRESADIQVFADQL